MADSNYFRETDKGYEDLLETFDDLADNEGVTIGVHAKDNEPADDQGSIGLAGLLSVHELGAFIEDSAFGDVRIPPRPVLRPAVSENTDKIGSRMEADLERVLDGNISTRVMYRRVGALVQGLSRSRFGDKSVLEPLSPVTVALRRKNSEAPLVDTGQLKQSIDYVVNAS